MDLPKINMEAELQTPSLTQRTRPRLLLEDDDEGRGLSLHFAFEESLANESEIVAFGKIGAELRLVLKMTTTDLIVDDGKTSFLKDTEVTAALRKGRARLTSKVDESCECGSLGEACVHLTGDLEGHQQSEQKKTLLWMLVGIDEMNEKVAKHREHLTELLVLLAELASQGDTDKCCLCMKHFVHFLLDFVLLCAIGQRKHKCLLDAMDLRAPADAEENANEHICKTLAKQATVARIVGHDGMDSVASSFDSKTLALKTLPTTL